MSESTERFIKWIVLAIVITLIWNGVMTNIISLYFSDFLHGASLEPNSPGIEEWVKSSEKIDVFYNIVIVGPIKEEFVFRCIPIMIVACIIAILGLTGIARFLTMLAMIIGSSILFGYMHNGWISVVFQGFNGFVYSLLFLKFWGWKFWKSRANQTESELPPEGSLGAAFLVITLTHALLNLIYVLKAFYG